MAGWLLWFLALCASAGRCGLIGGEQAYLMQPALLHPNPEPLPPEAATLACSLSSAGFSLCVLCPPPRTHHHAPPIARCSAGAGRHGHHPEPEAAADVCREGAGDGAAEAGAGGGAAAAADLVVWDVRLCFVFLCVVCGCACSAAFSSAQRVVPDCSCIARQGVAQDGAGGGVAAAADLVVVLDRWRRFSHFTGCEGAGCVWPCFASLCRSSTAGL